MKQGLTGSLYEMKDVEGVYTSAKHVRIEECLP